MKTRILCPILFVMLVVGWSTTASAQQTLTNGYSQAVLADQPVVYYQFQESPGATSAVDSSGNGNTGLYNNVILGNTNTQTLLGYAAAFNPSSNSYVSVPALPGSATLGGAGNNQVTIECWINPASTGGSAIYANPWLPGALNYLWDWNGPGIQFSLNGNNSTGTTVFDSNPPIPTGQWTYVVTVYDATAAIVTVYVNGIAVGSNTFLATSPISFDPGQIGAQTSAGGRYFNGLIDDFAIYTNTLSLDRIQAHYAAAAGAFVSITNQPKSVGVLVGHKGTFTTGATVVGANLALTYQWYTNGVAIAGATNASYTTWPVALTDNETVVNCVVNGSGAVPATTGNAFLFVTTSSSYTNAVLADQPLVFYQFGESQGATTAVDSSGHGNNGTYVMATNGIAGPVAGGSAVSLPGWPTGGGVVTPAMGSAFSLGGAGNNQFTIECWINPQTAGGASIWGNDWQAGALNYLWDWTGPGIQVAFNSAGSTGSTIFDSTPPIPLNAWSYVTTVYDATALYMICYVNGVAVGTNTFLPGAGPMSIDTGAIGAQSAAVNDRFFQGGIAEFAMYTNVLSAAQVVNHYAAALVVPSINPPTVSISNSGSGVSVSWNATGYHLQETANVGAPASWQNVANGSNSPVNVPIQGGSMFFRLISN
jgi:hypothetical protein